MQSRRLATGGRLDRNKPVGFVFNGVRYEGFQGDTLASALLANSIHVVGRSFKYHRPRGIVGSGAEEPNAILQIGRGAHTLPNYRATQVELYEGLVASSVNTWPSLGFDVMAVNGWLSRFMPAGFYYKTFLWPHSAWKRSEHLIRRASGLGTVPPEADPDRYDKHHAHCDVLVIGGGPAGLAAALEAGRRGARVLLVDDQAEFGGRLLDYRHEIAGAPGSEWVASTLAELASIPEVQLLPRSTVFGYYDHNYLGILQRVSDHLGPGSSPVARQRLWGVRARQVVSAAGAFERPLVFHNNDRPGVMLASAVSAYVNRYAVAPGRRAVLLTNNDSAYQTVLDMLDAEIEVAAVVDLRANVKGELPSRVRQRGIEVLYGHAVLNVRGTRHVRAVTVGHLDPSGMKLERGIRSVPCDFLAVSGGWNPVLDMSCQSGAKARYDAPKACFLPGSSVQSERSAGACNGSFELGACIREGIAAGAGAAHRAGFGNASPVSSPPAVIEEEQHAVRPCWLVPSRFSMGRGPKRFVDFQNDTTVSDIAMAVSENFRSIEHVKRYTLLGFGTEQGKLGNVNGIGIVAQILGTDLPSVGTTTFRPAYSPVTFGALCGRNLGSLFDPVRKTPIYEWHLQAGATFENVGQWKRAWYYPRNRETLDEAVKRESLATQQGVGILDYSTLGKIDAQGPDAARFLDLVYTNDKSRLAIGRCNYGFLLTEEGMLLDDGIAARLGENHFFLTTTTGGAARVMTWLERWHQTEWSDLKVYLTSVTEQWANLSINGPRSRDLISELCGDIDFSREAFPFMSFREGTVAGVPARVFRVSFSGELAFEINVPANYGLTLWDALISAGKKYDITPYGTETMHVLRADKGYMIVGQDTDGSVTPMDLGMHWILSKKKEYLGKRSLTRPEMLRKDRKQFVGLLTEDPGEVLTEGAHIVANSSKSIPTPMEGHVTSSYFSARLGRSIALAMLKGGAGRIGEVVSVPRLDGRVVKASVSSPVFYDPEGALQNA